MAATDKDTIYIDIDDEITGIIDKVKGSDGKLVALVLPKRASVFQSIVNMKLLKRAADDSKKHLVLITTEAGLLPLAGAAGVHVAKTLTSAPEIPSGPVLPAEAEETVSEDLADSGEAVDPNQTVGELAGAGEAGVTSTMGKDGVETLVLDDEDLAPEADGAGAKTFEPPAKGKGKGKGKKLSVPDFERFRLLLIAGGLLLVLLIGIFIFLATALPKATISIKTDATNVDTNVGLALSTTATQLVPSSGVTPAKLASIPKVYTQQVPTTGQKNNGNKASGTVEMSAGACGSDIPSDVPAGTGLSSNGQTYITQASASFTPVVNKGKCTFQSTSSTTIIAQNGGTSYNGANSFTVAGRPGVTATAASAISGGTDSIVQTVNQNDITNAKNKITANDTELRQTLQSQLQKDGYYAIAATYQAGTPNISPSANVGDVASNVTVTESITYTMFGAHKEDLHTLLKNDIKGQIDTNKQAVLDDGLDKATFNVDSISPTGAQVTMNTTATAGPDLDIAAIKQAAAGKKPGPVKDELGTNPDVTGVDVKLSPFWVSSIPKKTSRITVNIAKPTVTKSSDSNGGSN